jgi:hypothetical protein
MAGICGTTHFEKRTMKPSVLRNIVRRVVEAAQPEKIILFGSAAPGDLCYQAQPACRSRLRPSIRTFLFATTYLECPSGRSAS